MSWFLIWSEDRVCTGVVWRGGLSLQLSFVCVGLWFFKIFSISCSNSPCTVIFSLSWLLCMLLLEERRLLSRCEHCSTAGKDPRSEPLSRLYLEPAIQGTGVIHLGIPQDARKVDGMVGTHIVTKMINVQYAPLRKLRDQ